METWTGMAESVEWTRLARPTWLRRCAFQVGTRAATESMSSCSLLLASLEVNRGAPWYLVWKGSTRHGNACKAFYRSSVEQAIGVMVHLSMLVMSPDAPANNSRTWRMAARSWSAGASRMTRSSA